MFGMMPEIYLLSFHDLPVAQGALLRIKVDTHLHQSALVALVGQEISFRIYLLQGIRHRAVHLHLYHVDSVRHVEHGIRPARGAPHFRLDILPHQFDHDIEYRLEMLLRLVVQVIRYRLEESLHLREHILHIIIEQRLVESRHRHVALYDIRCHIIGVQRLKKSRPHLLVRDAQRIEVQRLIIILDGDIPL